MVLLTIVVILTVVIPFSRWVDRKGYDTLLVAALIIPMIYLFLPTHGVFYDAFYSFIEETAIPPL